MSSRFLQLLLTITLLFFGLEASEVFACGFDYVGDCATSAKFSVNGSTSEFLFSRCPYGTAFGGNLGSNVTDLKLTNAITRTWESCTNNVMQSSILYRIYTDANNKGSFQRVNLTKMTLYENPPYRSKWYNDDLSVNLLSNLQGNTSYKIEIYFEVGVDSDGNGSVDQTGVRNNDGAFYSAQFQTGNIDNTPPAFTLSILTTSTTCKNGADASAIVKAIGGKAPFQYVWSSGAVSDTAKNLKAGNYAVTATDSTGAKASTTFSISEPTGIALNMVVANPACLQNNGTIAVTASGGLTPYKYVWSTVRGDTSASISTLAAGSYSVTVSDSKNCSTSASATLIENCGTPGSYCTSNSLAPWNEWIARVQLATLDNQSSKTRPDKYAQGYSDWKDKNTALTTSQNYTLTVTPGISYDTYKSNLYFRVWIDFNNNGTLDDTEIVLEKNSVSQAVTQTFTVPQTAKAGVTMMRVSMKKGSNPTSCGSFDAGEVEDYSITLVGGVPVDCSLDSVPPVLTNCPANINLVTIDSVAVATWTNPIATDNCATTPSVSSNFNSNSPFKIGTTDVVITAKDDKNNQSTCTFKVIVTKQVIDTTSGGKNDLGLLVETSTPTYNRFTTKTFRVKLTNTAPLAYSNIKVQFKYPDGTANGGTVVPSVGTWSSYCSGGVQCYEWTIPSLAANSVGTLDVPLFILNINTPINATAKLLSSTPVDTSIANNSYTLVVNPSANALNEPLNLQKQTPSQFVPIVIQAIEPTVTEGDMFIALESLNDRELEFVISNSMGKIVKVEKRSVTKGFNRIQFDVSSLQGGVYLVVPSSNIARNVPTKFVKL